MKNRGLVTSIVLLTLATFLVVCVGAIGAADPGALATSKCAACHDLKRVCKNLGVKDDAAWQESVSRMVAKGDKVNAADGKVIAEYLTGLKAGAKPICE